MSRTKLVLGFALALAGTPLALALLFFGLLTVRENIGTSLHGAHGDADVAGMLLTLGAAMTAAGLVTGLLALKGVRLIARNRRTSA